MLETFHLKPPDYRAQPWKNGLGETREIAVDEAVPFRWRLSWASLSGSMPFSSFPGYDRQLVLLNGGPLALQHEQARKLPLSREVAALRVYPFKGELQTVASVPTPCEDFNVMCLRGAARASVYPTHLHAGEDFQFPASGQEHFFFGVDGVIELLEPNTGTRLFLGPRETFRISRKTTREYINFRARGSSPHATVMWVVVHLS